MSKEEMLKRIIDNLLVGESPRTVIKYLLYLGFTTEDIVSLNFNKRDVDEMYDVLESEHWDGECLCPIFP